MEEVTFIIKTFERPYCVKRLVKSIFKYYPDAIILIGDDSEETCREYFQKKYKKKNITVFELEKDCGLSYGRNYLVSQVKTKYFVLLDDDCVFDKQTDIEFGLKTLVENDLDIVGGYARNYPVVYDYKSFLKMSYYTVIKRERPSNYIGQINYDPAEKILYVDYQLSSYPEFARSDIVLNFFVARTQAILEKNMWDNDLKMSEHTAFFVCAKRNGVKVGYTSRMSIQHKPIKTGEYAVYRSRKYDKIYMEKLGIKTIIATYDNGKTLITEYDKLK